MQMRAVSFVNLKEKCHCQLHYTKRLKRSLNSQEIEVYKKNILFLAFKSRKIFYSVNSVHKHTVYAFEIDTDIYTSVRLLIEIFK